MEIAKRDRLCFNCVGCHKVVQCMFKFKCKVSNTNIIPACVHLTQIQRVMIRLLGKQQPPQNCLYQPYNFPTHSLCKAAFVYIVKTVIAMVSTAHHMRITRVIFNEGAQRSSITKEMATKN